MTVMDNNPLNRRARPSDGWFGSSVFLLWKEGRRLRLQQIDGSFMFPGQHETIDLRITGKGRMPVSFTKIEDPPFGVTVCAKVDLNGSQGDGKWFLVSVEKPLTGASGQGL